MKPREETSIRYTANSKEEALMLAKIKDSGLTPADVRVLNLEPKNAVETAKLNPSFAPQPSFKIPYFNLKGEPTDFYRIRYLPQPQPFKTNGSPVAKLIRYMQPPNTTPSVYFPPYLNWAVLSQSPESSLVITEGELKAACACKHKIATLGIGGVWAWQASKRGYDLIPELAAFKWSGRRVYIAFDTDMHTNPQVMSALHALADKLTELGAVVYLISLPILSENNKKMGLDDFLVHPKGGSEKFIEICSQAEPFNMVSELWTMNKTVVLITDQAVVINQTTGQRMPLQDFMLIYANRFMQRSIPGANGGTQMKKIPAAKAWLEWPQRYELPTVVYEPGRPRLLEEAYNTWSPWPHEPVKGSVKPWIELMKRLIPQDEYREWFERWCAYPIQHPGAKLNSACVLWGPTHGTGKSIVGYTLMRIYGNNSVEIGTSDLWGSFNAWAHHRQFVMGDEITSQDKRASSEKLRSLITQREVTINAKFQAPYEIRDCINYYFTSNQPDAIFIEDTDRRFFVQAVRIPTMDQAFRVIYDTWYKSDDGINALHYHLLHLPLGNFDPFAHPPVTESKQEMWRDSRSDLALWLINLRESPDEFLKLGNTQYSCDLWLPNELLRLYDPGSLKNLSLNAFSRELKRLGFIQVAQGKQVFVPGEGPLRLYAMRRQGHWCSKNMRNEQIISHRSKKRPFK